MNLAHQTVFMFYRILRLIFRKHWQKQFTLTSFVHICDCIYVRFVFVCHGVDAFKIVLITMKQQAAHKTSTTCTLQMHSIDWRAQWHCTLSNHRPNVHILYTGRALSTSNSIHVVRLLRLIIHIMMHRHTTILSNTLMIDSKVDSVIFF